MLVTIAGLILFTFKIPDSVRDNGFRCGRFNKPDGPMDDEGFAEAIENLVLSYIIGLDSTSVSVCSAAAGTDARSIEVLVAPELLPVLR